MMVEQQPVDYEDDDFYDTEFYDDDDVCGEDCKWCREEDTEWEVGSDAGASDTGSQGESSDTTTGAV